MSVGLKVKESKSSAAMRPAAAMPIVWLLLGRLILTTECYPKVAPVVKTILGRQ
jgi:hypothetical protein